jgi:cell division protein FtsN
MEVKVPESQLGEGVSDKAPTLAPGVYVLQVGSFQRFEEADKAKATLALHGIVADIQKVVINNGDTWYRVRIGPFKDLKAVQAMRAKLTASGMDFMLLRIKDGQS